MRKMALTILVAVFVAATFVVAPAMADCQDDCKKAYQAHLDRCAAAAQAGAQDCRDKFGGDPKALKNCLKRVKKEQKKCAKAAKATLKKCLKACP